jgi:hypothetical protein
MKSFDFQSSFWMTKAIRKPNINWVQKNDRLKYWTVWFLDGACKPNEFMGISSYLSRGR